MEKDKSIESRVHDYYTKEVGYDLLELTHGFILYYEYEDSLIMNELYIHEDERSIEAYRTSWDEINTFCRERNLKRVNGMVNLNKHNANKIIRTHIRFGSVVIAAQNNVVEFYKEVDYGK